VKEDLLDNMEQSEWHPQWGAGQPVPRLHRGRARLERLPPALLGILIPIWVPEDAEAGNLDDDMIVIGTREELGERVEEDIDPKTIDLHRPAVDDLTVVEDGTTYRRVEDVFDVWLDLSGLVGHARVPER